MNMHEVIKENFYYLGDSDYKWGTSEKQTIH